MSSVWNRRLFTDTGLGFERSNRVEKIASRVRFLQVAGKRRPGDIRRRVARQKEDFDVRVEGADLLSELRAGDPGKDDVRDHRVDIVAPIHEL